MTKRTIPLLLVSMILTGCGSQPTLVLEIEDIVSPRLALHQNIQLEIKSENISLADVIWSSSDGGTISVNEEGLVTSLLPGSATIKAELKDKPEIFDTIEINAYCLVDDINELKNTEPVYQPLDVFTPQKFNAATWSVERNDELADGANLVVVNLELNSGRQVEANILEVDLKKSVDIVAGSYNNMTTLTGKKQNLYGQIQAYENMNPDKKVIGATNADFFGNFPVNAFVKDNMILKDAHLDNGGYDYTNTNNDIPASMPMLFGVNDKFAQVGAIIDHQSVEKTIKSKLTYELHAINNEGAVVEHYEDVQRNAFSLPDYSRVNLITSTSRDAKAPVNATVYTLKKHTEGYLDHGEIVAIEKVTTLKTIVPANDYAYVIVPEDLTNPSLELGNFFAYHVASEDGKWDHYQHIIGARQELVANGEIPYTVRLENTNGAQTTNIPRTAVGIKEDGKVVLLAIESLYYGKKSTSSDDPYGVNLPELAEIMRYYGCVNAGNFDGGGSTQMIVHQDNLDQVIVRSSDYGTDNLSDGRAIINSVLVVSNQ